MLGMNRITGRAITGWDHVIQSLGVIFTTRFHERVMLRYFGSLIPHMLGENMVERTLVAFFASVGIAIDLWEPRFRLVNITVLELDRQGRIGFKIEGVYSPNAQTGDHATEYRRSFYLMARQTGLVVLPTSEDHQ